ncbi:MAG: hypothetical protein L3J20_03745 [Flavobacteriaceae bacterium]|nr:hypothetical protein [Flavobacteriaceae bacterium]
MLPIRITFQAYIPKSLGKPLLSYFQNHPNFNSKDMINFDEFKRDLQSKDVLGGSTWIPEPLIGSVRDTFFATDNIDFHDDHSQHGKRLSIEASIDLTKIGKFGVFDTIFSHKNHDDGSANKLYHQHSDESHQVQAYIQKVPSHVDTGTTFIETDIVYRGVFDEKFKRTEEVPLKTSIDNKLTGTFFHTMGTRVENNTTVIKVSASAGYPFAEPFSPNIDFELEIKLIKDILNKHITVNVKGLHNDFPAYELLVNGLVKYNYNPEDHDYSGPTLYNLGMASRDFNTTEWVNLSDWEIKEMERNNDPFGW